MATTNKPKMASTVTGEMQADINWMFILISQFS